MHGLPIRNLGAKLRQMFQLNIFFFNFFLQYQKYYVILHLPILTNINTTQLSYMFGLFRKKSNQPRELFFHTDVHCHLIPGIDDGSRSAELSVELINRMLTWGITDIIATPHVTEDSFENTPEHIDKAFRNLIDAIKRENIKINVSHSAEYRIDSFFMSQLDAGNITPLKGDYLLVENSYVQEPWELDKILFDLKLKGYIPVLAHPERYVYYHDKRNRYNELHRTGTLFQANLLSFAGYYGKNEKKAAEYLLEHNLIDFIGTDMHNHRHSDAIHEFIVTKEYRELSERLKGRILNDRI